MFLTRLLNKIPYFRNRQKRKTREQLSEVITDFDGGYYSDHSIVILHNILKASVVRFNEELVIGSLGTINTHSNTSVMALRALLKGDFKKGDLERSHYVKLDPVNRRFLDWYSNQESVEDLIQFATEQLDVHHIHFNPEIGLDYHGNQLIDFVEEQQVIFLESLLFRMLMVDTANILYYYLENDE